MIKKSYFPTNRNLKYSRKNLKERVHKTVKAGYNLSKVFLTHESLAAWRNFSNVIVSNDRMHTHSTNGTRTALYWYYDTARSGAARPPCN